MKRIDKIYRDEPDPAGLYEAVIEGCCKADEGNCSGDCGQCAIDYLNEEVPDTEFIEKLKAVKLLFPLAKKLAMDKNGRAFIYRGKQVNKSSEKWVSRCHSRHIEGLNDYSSDWENSLIDIDEVIKEAEQ